MQKFWKHGSASLYLNSSEQMLHLEESVFRSLRELVGRRLVDVLGGRGRKEALGGLETKIELVGLENSTEFGLENNTESGLDVVIVFDV